MYIKKIKGMKKVNLLYLLLGVFSVMGFTSCEEEGNKIWDISPIEFQFFVKDKDSMNLLNDSTTRAEFMENVSITYKNKEYKCEGVLDSLYYANSKSIEESRMINVVFSGFTIKQIIYMTGKPYVISFGEFPGTDEKSEISFTINWGDGTKDEVYYKGTFNYTDDEPITHREFYVNGKLVSDKGAIFQHTFIK